MIIVPDGKDPDDFVRKHGKENFNKLVKKALPLFDYRLQYILKHSNLTTTDGKVEALKKILPAVSSVRDSARYSEYRKKISAALRLDERAVFKEWQKFTGKIATEDKTSHKIVRLPKSPEKKSLLTQACEMILRMSWQEPDLLDFALAIVPKEIFSETQREIAEYIKRCCDFGQRPNDLTAAEELSEKALSEISAILSAYEDDPRSFDLKAFEDSVRIAERIWTQKIYDDKVKTVIEHMKTDSPAYREEMQEAIRLQKKLDKLK